MFNIEKKIFSCYYKKVFILMDSWEKFDETSLPPGEASYSNLNLEDISDEDYANAEKVWDVFEINNHREYHNLYV